MLPYISYDITENIVFDQLGIRRTIRSNERYLHHKYDIQTCGDKEQIYLSTSSNTIDADVTDDLFDRIMSYMHDKFKRGIFVSIRDNRLDKFIPFINESYINDYASLLNTSAKKDIFRIKNLEIIDEHFWYADNSVMYIYRNSLDNMSSWNEAHNQYRDTLINLLESESIQDCDFFINVWCYPILKRDGSDPWIYKRTFDDSLNDIDNIPILSISTNSSYKDTLIPSYRDIVSIKDDISLPIVNKVLYKGTSVCSSDAKKNYYDMCVKYPDMFNYHATTSNDSVYIDNNLELKVRQRNIQSISSTMTSYRYAMMINSHAACFEFSKVLQSDHIIPFYVKGDVYSYIEQYLVEWVHYIPVREDMKDLIINYKWIESNPEKANEMIGELRKLRYLIDIKHIHSNLKQAMSKFSVLKSHTKRPILALVLPTSYPSYPLYRQETIVYHNQLWKQDHAIYVSSLIDKYPMVKIREGISLKYTDQSKVSLQHYITSSKITVREVMQIVINIAHYLDNLYTKHRIAFISLRMSDVYLAKAMYLAKARSNDTKVYTNDTNDTKGDNNDTKGDTNDTPGSSFSENIPEIHQYDNCYIMHPNGIDVLSGPTIYAKYQTNGILSLITEICHYMISCDTFNNTDYVAINRIFKELYEPFYSNRLNNVPKGLTQKRKFLKELSKAYCVSNFMTYQHSKKKLQTNKGYAEKIQSIISA